MNARLDGPTARRWVTLALTALASARQPEEAGVGAASSTGGVAGGDVAQPAAARMSREAMIDRERTRRKRRLLAEQDPC